jgi:hypothetical protein
LTADLPAPSLTLAGRFEKDHERRYAHVPFAVPPGLRQLHIRYSYSDQIDSDPLVGGGNTLDIGLFDESGIAEGSPGFRGWSGSNKMELTIDEGWATPPYRKGKIGSGTWHVLLGPYKVGPRGCDWKVEIWFDPGLPSAWRMSGAIVRRDPDPLPEARPGWLRGDLHCHTLYSDGDSWPPEMLNAAAEAGLDFLGVTDHNNVAHQLAYGPGGDGLPIVLPGVEVTTYGGHWNAWGTDRWWEFREPESQAVERTMRAAMRSGAVVSICHPKPFGPPWEYSNDGGFHAIEVWNGPWAQLNAASVARWENMLGRGIRCVAVGGSDTHYLRPRENVAPRHADSIGTPTTWVQAERNVASILSALREGRSFVSASPRGAQLYLNPDPARRGRVVVEVRNAQDTTLQLLDDAGAVSVAGVSSAIWEEAFPVRPGSRYVRAEVVAATGECLALSNPIWTERL